MYRKLWLLTWTFLLVCAPSLIVQAQEKKNGTIEDMPELEKQRFREHFISEFRRIGMNTTPEDGRLLRILVEGTGSKSGVEVGSANGYGAIHMGMGFERTGGKLITVDIDPDMVSQCRQNVKSVGLSRTVTCMEGDALKILPSLKGPIDFVFIDAAKEDYLNYLKALEPKLSPRAMIVADNVIRFRDEMKDFLETLEASPDYDMVIIRASEMKDDGMAIISRIR